MDGYILKMFPLMLSLYRELRDSSDRKKNMGEVRNAYRNLIGILEGKRPRRWTRSRWEYNIRMDHRKSGWEMWTD